MTILVTGGAGFIGSNFIHEWFATSREPLVNLDKLTYAGHLDNLAALPRSAAYTFVEGDICDRGLLASLLAAHRPRAVLNFAAESHVDRSVTAPAAFIQTNLVGTFQLLEAVRDYLAPSDVDTSTFRFLQVSTDEVYGSLTLDEPSVREDHRYAPSSPYSASKAGADHLVSAYWRTFGLPVLLTNCSNNYGPWQHPEKLIPLTICSALAGRPLPVYGNGRNVRDWLFVTDHCTAIRAVLEHGRCGEAYNVGADSQKRNIDVVESICDILEEIAPSPHNKPYRALITYVTDRPGHDLRYALSPEKIHDELGWRPTESFATGLRKTVQWYVENSDWARKRLSEK